MFDIANPIRWVVDIGQENVASAGELRNYPVEDAVQSAPECLFPNHRLLILATIQCSIASGSSAIIMNQIVAAGGDDNNSPNRLGVPFQMQNLIAQMLR